jgi:oxygen-independent coproporphyrinogen-3 oxidase
MSRTTVIEQRVPRYTSYPAAPHFHAGVTAARYSDWLSHLDPLESISLYIHVPFCVELCLYCGCHTKATRRPEPVIRYVAGLRREIELLRAHLGYRRLAQIHWGGGTPSIVGAAQMSAIVGDLHRHFDLTSLQEHAIELDPRHADAALVDGLSEIGVTRASLGVQEFSDRVQKAIGRVQPLETVARLVGRLREAGIASVNFDLMYGLPRQTVRDVENTARTTCVLQPSRIALFGYAHVPWMKKHQTRIEESTLPDSLERHAQLRAARAIFQDAGYLPVGFDHFASPGDELGIAAKEQRVHRNFQGYTIRHASALVGIGASSISRLPSGYAQNAADVGAYLRAIDSARLATVRGIELTREDRLRGEMIEALLCKMELDLRPFVAAIGRPLTQEKLALRRFSDQGYVRLKDDLVSITEKGRDFARLIASAFDAYSAHSTLNASNAI